MRINPGLEHLSVDVDELRADPRNARLHDERSVETIAVSLREFGQQKPIVALGDGTVIAGNGTLEAARALGWERIAVVRFSDVAKARAFAIADNRTAELSSWDNDVLAEVLGDLREDFDLAALGFNGFDLRRILGDFEPASEDDEDDEGSGEAEGAENAARQVVVYFRSDADAKRFGELLGQRVTKKTRSLWWPG